MTTYSPNNPYNIWDFRKSIGIFRNVIPAFNYWMPLFSRQVNSTDEYIDFEKLPALNRRLAPFVRPLAQGKPIYTDQSTAFRFKPAYIKLKDVVDSTRIVSKIPGVDAMLDNPELANDPMARREALKTAIVVQHVNTIQRRWEWMAARAAIDGMVTIAGEDYPAVQLDFRRNANQTQTLAAGSRWGDSGVSIVDYIQSVCDTMIYPQQNADGSGGFGGFPVRMTVGSLVWKVMRKDPEIKDLMNKFFPVKADIERGMIASEKVVKVGDLNVGGAGGAVLEVYLYRDSYQADNGTEVPLMQPTDVVFNASAEAIQGFRCFGAIIDPFARYQSLDIFARNWMETGDPANEYLLHQSAPLMVPVNPNAFYKATVVAAS